MVRRYIISGLFLSCVLVASIAHADEQKKQYFVECQMIRDGKVVSSPHIVMIEGQGVSFSVAEDTDIAGQNVKAGATLTATNSIQEGVMVLSGKLNVTEVVADSKVKTKMPNGE